MEKLKTTRRLLIYITHPYSSKDAKERVDNVIDSIEIWNKLVEKGHVPINPLLSHYTNKYFPRKQEFWYLYDLAILKRCDAILINGMESSRGVRLEFSSAKEWGLQIFMDIDDIPDARSWESLLDKIDKDRKERRGNGMFTKYTNGKRS